MINDEECYVIEGNIKGMYVKYWISKDRNIIVRQYREGIVLDYDAQEADGELKEMMNVIKSASKDNPKVTCEYSNIRTDIEKKVAEFSFVVPEGARLSEDIFVEIIAHRLSNMQK